MGKWKKAVAALAAVPMLMALAPAANAVESDPTDSSAAQRALAAALKSNAKAAADSDLLASLDFDNVAAGATGTIVDDTTGDHQRCCRSGYQQGRHCCSSARFWILAECD